MAHKKAQGSTNNGRDSNAKRLGVKIFGGQKAVAGNIIVRQKGNKFWAGEGVSQGHDFTLYAVKDGIVTFSEKRRKRFDGRVYREIFVSVV
ncbi:50S ribosomal protein L27 [Candidatus Gracilibacteria bacterium GN02-872]|nr:50S ribosomal protein L27 [Candidatus Gracilibacteria bacterium GN02-872]RKW21032.1 MAG: 50S ribosomal protein L27 [Candidatus Gracilibacteria bacterium]